MPQGISGEIVIESDPKVGQGGCVIETPGGVIDARIHTQLDELCHEVFGDGEETSFPDAIFSEPKPVDTSLIESETDVLG
jgi:hypothetical protein